MAIGLAAATPATSTPSATPTPTPSPTIPDPPKPLPGPAVPADQVVGGPRLLDTGAMVVDAAHATGPVPQTYDRSVIVADLDSGEILAALNPHAWLYPASTLKTLLCLVVIPRLDPTAKVVATRGEVTAEGTRVGMVEGATYTVDQLLGATILISGNDSAYALAEAAGGRAQTIERMNQQAAELGAWDTVAVDPSGLDEPGQRSSAYDLALIGRAVMALPAYRRWAATKQMTFPGAVEKGGASRTYKPFVVGNHNRLFWNYPGTIGVKNGHTTLAENTYVGAATRGGHTILIVQMGHVQPSWQNSAALFDWGFANLGRVTPVGQLVAPGTAAQPVALGGTATASSSSPPTSTSSSTSMPPAGSPSTAVTFAALDALGSAPVRRGLGSVLGFAVVLVLLRARVRRRRRGRRAGSYRR